MYYSEDEAKKLLLKVIEDLKNNPKCDIPDAELMQRYREYTQGDHLTILTKMLNALEDERRSNKA